MKIAVTGANGFVGSNLVKHFISPSNEVKAIIRANASTALIPRNAHIVRVDYNDVSSLLSAFTGIDIIIHNAGKTKALDAEQMFNTNLGITEKVIEAVNRIAEQVQIIYLSSQAASRPSVNNIPVKEDEPSAPLTAYGKSKLAAEQAFREKCGKNYTIIRPCSLYGCVDRDFLQLFKMVDRGFSFKIGHRDKLLNMLYISELCSFIELCLHNPAAYFQTFFATDGQVYKQSDIFSAIANALNKHPIQITIPEKLAKVVFYTGDLYGHLFHKEVVANKEKMKEILADSWLADISKARNILGWQPEANLAKNIKETATCYRALGWL